METKQITVPDGWHQVRLSQFIELSNLDTNSPNHSVMAVSILTDIDSEEIRKYDTDSFGRILSALDWSTKLPEQANFKKIIEIDGVKYGLINRFSELLTGNWIDIEEYLNDYPNSIHKILSILYRPLVDALNDDFRIIEDYDSISGAERAEIFLEKMNVEDIHGAVVFFCLIGNLSIKNTKTYLEGLVLMEMSKTKKKRNQISGLGTRMFTDWQRGILQKLKVLQG